MNQSETKDALLGAARVLFAKRGFNGTTVRAITAAAGANLGAVTYHFGTKRGLYHAVLETATAPIRERVSRLGADRSTAIDQIEATVRGMFAIIREHNDVPRLLLQVLTAEEPLPPPIEITIRTNLAKLTHLVAAGQRDGSVRTGSPTLLALSFAAQPIFFGIYRRALEEAIGLDQEDETTTAELVDTVVTFIRAGLATK